MYRRSKSSGGRRSVASWATLVTTVVLVLVPAASASAQDPLSDVLSFLLTNRGVPTGDFERDAAAARATRDTMSRLLLVELSTQPVSAASPGFVYHLNPTLGTPQRASESFGPFFTERSLTTGARRLTLGLAYTARRFTRLDGRDLDDGSFVTSGNQFRDEAQPFDVETLSMSLETRTFTATGTVGVHDRVDVGVVVPFVSLALEGQRTNTYRGTSVVQATADATASGIGDIAVRSKVRLLGARGSGLASVIEVRLPTGREEDLLGAGSAAVVVGLVASAERGPIGLHGTAGVSRGELAAAWHYRGAFTANASRHVTLVAELIGAHVDEAGSIGLARVPHPTISGVDTLRLLPEDRGSQTAQAVLGAKWNVARTWLLGVHATMPITDRGLRAAPALVIGLEYSAGR
jgi:hypothetical protein